MQAVVLIIHLVICVALIGLVLLQRSEGGALGVGGGSGSLMSGRGAADTLAKMTQFAGAFFLGTSLLLTWMSGASAGNHTRSIFDAPAHQSAPVTPAPTPILPPPIDPTQSSAPEAAPSTQLAATAPPPAANVAPPPTTAAAHAAAVSAPATHNISTTVAGPLTPTATTRAPPAQRAAATPAVTRPAATASNRPAATAPVTTARNRPAATASTTTNRATTPATLPPGVALTQTIPESDDTGQNGLEAVRHSRAGPDQ